MQYLPPKSILITFFFIEMIFKYISIHLHINSCSENMIIINNASIYTTIYLLYTFTHLYLNIVKLEDHIRVIMTSLLLHVI